MPDFFFPDNTVLVNFAHINRMDLLKRLLNGKGKWCATVSQECARSSREPGLDAMQQAPDIFGPPEYPLDVELQDTLLLRQQITRPDDHPKKSLGEAETLAIMSRRFMTAWFITDDKEARRLAEEHHVISVTTWDLLKLAVKLNYVDADTLWGYLQTLRALRRGAPDGVLDRPSFDRWIAS
jgi:predicted nucleic acid-binding protein